MRYNNKNRPSHARRSMAECLESSQDEHSVPDNVWAEAERRSRPSPDVTEEEEYDLLWQWRQPRRVDTFTGLSQWEWEWWVSKHGTGASIHGTCERRTEGVGRAEGDARTAEGGAPRMVEEARGRHAGRRRNP